MVDHDVPTKNGPSKLPKFIGSAIEAIVSQWVLSEAELQVVDN